MSDTPDTVTRPLSWSIHRLREQPVKSALAGVFLACFLLFSLYGFGLLLTVVAAAVFAAALNTWYLPVRYTFDRRGVTVDKRVFSHTYPWEQFRRWFRTSNGVVLSPFSRRTFLDTFRGVHLLLPADPGPVLDWLARRFDEGKGSEGPNWNPGTPEPSSRLDSRDSTVMMDREELYHEE